ncbi:thioesterase II family protein [Burkholderia gladioli]|jgi:medium-chain acyl-[acyl-carrier-protein] hydrolase|uniref:thioesterase II family protein n=1 Tax=Burkholderia gladioli TaxID=28095 RepID=UPI00163EE5BF|nr:alpha/beta fold hydrolase [Burkholderia gladioli]
MSTTPWFTSRPNGQARLRMFCFSYAGGSGSTYLPWQARLDPAIELVAVQLPGRASRLREAPIDSLPALVEQIAARIQFPDRLPFVFYGHSLGGLVAFELARYCKLRWMRTPRKLFISGCDAPRHRKAIRNVHELEGEAFIEALAQYNGTPPELLEHRELMSLLAPAIRADFAMAANYSYRPGPLLDMPIGVLSGRDDVDLDLEHLGAWQRETSADCQVQWFEGDHFFIHPGQAEAAVLAHLNTELTALLRDGAPA